MPLATSSTSAVATDTSATPLRAWRAALANREYAQARLVHIGDSMVEGGTLTALSQRWQERLATQMRADYPVAGVVGGGPTTYLPAEWGTGNSLPAPATIAGTGTVSHANGLGRRGRRLRASGDSLTFAVTGRFLDIAYTRQSTLGTATVTIDGVPAAALNTATGGTGSFVAALKRYDMTTATAHTVVIAYSSGTDVYVDGVVVYNGDESKGVVHFDSGKFGQTTANFEAASTNAWMTTFAWTQPHCVTINLKTNGWKQNLGVTTYRTHMETIIASSRANITAPTLTTYVLVTLPQPVHPGTPTDTWASYAAADAAIAAANTGGIGGASQVVALDLSGRAPSPVTDNSLGLYHADLTHLTPKGNAWLADQLALFLGPQR